MALALGVGLRLLAWKWAAPPQLDELSYQSTARALVEEGRQRIFWPPLTGWLIALCFWLVGPSVAGARLLWLALDLGNLMLLGRLGERIGASLTPAAAGSGAALRGLVVVGYAIYLPAISYAVHTTSEIPALTLLLAILVLLAPAGPADPGAFSARIVAAGLAAGALVLTRPSLAPIPLALALVLARPDPAGGGGDRARRWGQAALLVGLATLLPLGYVARNQLALGQPVLAQNAAYNLHRGNGPVYQEDLNLFWPPATADQIAYRLLRARGGQEPPPPVGLTPSQMQQAAVAFIAQHPLLFLRRALGRAARLVAPRTEQLTLLGGEEAINIESGRALVLLLLGLLQFAPLLGLGTAGLLGLRAAARPWANRLLATLAGGIPLALVAIAKPRFGFVFEPLLLIAAGAFALNARAWRPVLGRPVVWGLGLFYAWAWLAWFIFGVTSRGGPGPSS